MAKLTIFVKTSKISVDLLKFVDENLEKINQRGVKVVVEKISSTSNDKCKKLKISRLPAMIDENGNVHVGAEKIMKIFRNNLGSRRDNPLESMYGVDGPTPEDDVQAYLASKMFRINEAGDTVPITTEEDSEEGEGKDFSAAMDRFGRKSPSKRKSSLPRPPSRRGRKQKKRRQQADDSDSDSSDEERADVAPAQADADAEEEMREQMLRVWRDGGN